MRLIWTTSNKIGAKIIRWGLDTDCSHFAISFDEDEDGNGFIFHSHFSGATPVWLKDFLKKNRIQHCLKLRNPPTIEQEEKIWKVIISEFHGQGYDFRALAFWTWRAFIHRVFGYGFPEKNYWGKPGRNLCTAIALGLQKAYPDRFNFGNSDNEMISPHALYLMLSKSVFLEDDEPMAEHLNRL
jgi:hypothetical protein